MKKKSFLMLDGKIVLWLHDRVCEDADALLASDQFRKFFSYCLADLQRKNSKYLKVFGHDVLTEADEERMVSVLQFLTRLPGEHVIKLVDGSDLYFADIHLFNGFVEHIYNTWRHFRRLIINQTGKDDVDIRPNRKFSRTIEHLTNLIRNTYRDIQVNITGTYPRIYRQVSAGAELAVITKIKSFDLPEIYKDKLDDVGVIRQVLMYPPFIFNSSMNKRTGIFEPVQKNPIEYLDIDPSQWLCYPAMVGSLVVMVYFSIEQFELNLALCNLFELAGKESLKKKPDAMVFFGVDETDIPVGLREKSYFYDDTENDLLVGVVPDKDCFGYFGYLKKLILTLHNIKAMKSGKLPFHGAMFQLKIHGVPVKNFLVMGDTGAGKSETLEAFRSIASSEIEDVTIVSDDMGSLSINEKGEVVAYGTEIGAFVRLDDLQPGYAFGQMDRAVIMNANQVNARVVIPVTTYDTIMAGHKIDYVFYANNYQHLEEGQSAIHRLETCEEALPVFREGKVMSKGTTTTTGIVGTYFANVFGPVQCQEMHEELARKYFQQMYDQGVFVGELMTQLGVAGCERNGPNNAAKDLLKFLKS